MKNSSVQLLDAIAYRKRAFGCKFTPETEARLLSSRWALYYNLQVRVMFSFGEVKFGRVGLTSGWQPVFGLVLTGRWSMYASLNENDRVVSDWDMRPWLLNTYTQAGVLVKSHPIWDNNGHFYNALGQRRKKYGGDTYVHKLEPNPDYIDSILAS